ncbi:dnaJ homolog subfamily C member 1 [Diorhabda carinulata]|uniref:dnaJ homolog subfamily C member 1 n=1 Tax=Diorhabda carinulata TaxID=1163345 RepID=UPI0025A1FE0B|nr:dnaJ homolog subfamily C member 1 [Diorhabda carinulata]XP_057657255.1 dnaJ homolog subfamily C member 1 [Diorhabda carinulata]
MNIIYLSSLLFYSITSTNAWDSEQLEVFDAVDDVKQNFYELLNISKDATSSEIKSAFRTLSLKLHPDKNKEVDTSEQFRNLVTVYEVLKSPAKRKYYDDTLINGLPNWRSGIFYYRYVRKMGITEVLVILFVIITIGQYLVNWGVYFEKILTVEDQKLRKKKSRNRGKVEEDPDIIIPKPSVLDTLPIQIPKFVWFLITCIPAAFRFLTSSVKNKIEVNRPLTPELEPEPVRIKTTRKRNKFILPEGPNFELQDTEPKSDCGTSAPPPPVSGGLWTDDDLTELIRLVKKFPQGTTERWEKIAAFLNRSVPEVTYMANKMKENGYRLPCEQDDEIQVKVKQKSKKEVGPYDSVTNWGQAQQKALEDALLKFPKGVCDRWDRIAEHVPDKNKEECMQRFRYLAEDLKKRKDTSDKTE